MVQMYSEYTVVKEIGGIKITRHDMEALNSAEQNSKAWINDKIIEAYLHILNSRIKKAYVFATVTSSLIVRSCKKNITVQKNVADKICYTKNNNDSISLSYITNR